MKKNLLFVIPSLSAGGGEKSLVNLLGQIDYSQYNVDLFLLNHKGLFMDYIPKEVNIVKIPHTYYLFTLPIIKSLCQLLLKGKFKLALNRIMYTFLNRTIQNESKREQYSWNFLSPSLKNLEKEYDVAIGFLEKTSTYFCVDKVTSNKKIGWIHNDYDKLGMCPTYDIKYFRKLDHIVTVSEECGKILKKRFPSEESKIKVIYNIVSPTMIEKMSCQEKTNSFNKNNDDITILSIGRLHHQKGFEMAIEACRKLVDKGYNIKWNIIGEGIERKKLSKLISNNSLEGRFNLLGLKSNPYPFIKQADIYAQTSRFEGKAIAIDEAKILRKPIVVTNFSTAKDQINHGVDGLIVDMNAEAIVKGIEKLIIDCDLRKTFFMNLSQLQLGTEKEIMKFTKLISGEST